MRVIINKLTRETKIKRDRIRRDRQERRIKFKLSGLYGKAQTFFKHSILLVLKVQPPDALSLPGRPPHGDKIQSQNNEEEGEVSASGRVIPDTDATPAIYVSLWNKPLTTLPSHKPPLPPPHTSPVTSRRGQLSSYYFKKVCIFFHQKLVDIYIHIYPF